VFCASGWAAETVATSGNLALFNQTRAAAATVGGARLERVIVERKGTDGSGVRYRIVLYSLARGVVSCLNLTADDGGLRVFARDVDGVGHDADLIVKNARTSLPVGVWINDHRGGFTVAHTGLYASAIWSEPPRLLAEYSSRNLQSVFRSLSRSCVALPAPLRRFERAGSEDLASATNVSLPSQLNAGARPTRGPPGSLYSISLQIQRAPLS